MVQFCVRTRIRGQSFEDNLAPRFFQAFICIRGLLIAKAWLDGMYPRGLGRRRGCQSCDGEGDDEGNVGALFERTLNM